MRCTCESGYLFLTLTVNPKKMLQRLIFFLIPGGVIHTLHCSMNWLSKRFVFLTFLGRFLPIKLRPLFGAVFF